MNSLILSLLLATSASVTAGTPPERAFSEWKLAFNKQYKTQDLEDKAYKNWLLNKAIIDKANSGSPKTFKTALNKFSDLSEKEFNSKMLMQPTSPSFFPRQERLTKKVTDVPTSFDWRTDGKLNTVTSVKDQGSVGSCWAFSTIGNIEGQWTLAGHDLIDLSAEYLVDCDGTHDENHADCSVFGGWPYLAYQFVIESEGVPSEATYPYCSGSGDCYPCMQGPVSLCGLPPSYCDKTITEGCPNFTAAASISDWSSVSTDEDEIAQVLYATGPLSVLLDATQLSYYSGGIWTGHIDSLSPYLGCHSESLNHAVLLVGYGEENGVKYWTVKNSWGEKWGEQGFFRIVRGEGLCGINTAVTTAIV